MEDKYKSGNFVFSTAGRDHGEIYVIIDSDSEYVYLVNGLLKTIDHPKKKKKKHIQITHYSDVNIREQLNQGKLLTNENIKKAIKQYEKNKLI